MRILLIGVLLAAGLPAQGKIAHYPSLGAVARDSSVVILGRITDVVSDGDDFVASITVDRVIRGRTKFSTVRVQFPAPRRMSQFAESVEFESAGPQFSQGERVIVGLKEVRRGRYLVVGGRDGKLEVLRDGEIDSVRVPVRYQEVHGLKEIELLGTVMKILKEGVGT